MHRNYFIVILLLFQVEAGAQVDVALTIENQYADGTDFYFDIYLTRMPSSQGDIYLGNSDFVLSFNHNNFTNPTFSKVGSGPGFCTFIPTTSSPSNDDFVRRTYFNGSATTISSNILRVNLAGPSPGDIDAFNTGVAKIDGQSHSHRLGRFVISGISNPSGTAGLAWITSGSLSTKVFSLSPIAPFNSSSVNTLDAQNPTDALLPVELMDFQVTIVDENKSKLSWQTASELNNEGFSIQRSSLDEEWIEIGFLPGHGASTRLQTYHFYDEKPLGGINYYRLGQIDFDGTIHYSPIRSIAFTKQKKLLVYPNPVKQFLYVDGTLKSRYRISDSHGITQKSDTLTKKSIDVSNLTPGIYFLVIDSATIKFLKW